ncbi:hypothetical protein NQ318_003775 [Aromia moschata]|uniref:Uncharacterized protein n=1 Tax=Aromia moschata TaxID=1265417 RepID=A0AAV8YH43_9CUCU|nr:hypothetical protein NQ318_003775 [Aromia moschata]
MDAMYLAVLVWMYLSNLKLQKEVSLPEISWNLSETIESELVLGTVQLTDLIITGFETLESQIENIESTEDENGDNNICVYVPLDYLELRTDYDADVGIADEIPLYGEGSFSQKIEDIKFNICTFVSFANGYVDDVKVTIQYRHNPANLTGWWKNERSNAFVLQFLNVFNLMFAMWNAYEPDRTSCLISPIAQYILNNNMEYENNTLSFDIECIKGVLADNGIDLNEIRSVEKYLFTAMSTYGHHLLDSSFEENAYILLKAVRPTISLIRTIMNDSE